MGLADVVDWVVPFARSPGAQPWPFNQILPFDRSDWSTLFRLAANAPVWAGARARAFEAVAEQQPPAYSLALTHPPTAVNEKIH